jgi:hypothetical protein
MFYTIDLPRPHNLIASAVVVRMKMFVFSKQPLAQISRKMSINHYTIEECESGCC